MADVFPESRVRLKADGIKWREVSGTIVVMDLNGSNYFAVEGSIASIWPSLVDGAVTADLAAQLSADFSTPIDVIQQDLLVFLQQLLIRGVLDVTGDHPS